jgi:hypothetical protein
MIEIPASIGEVFDKITILQIKQQNIFDPKKQHNVTKELELLLDRVRDVDVNPLLLNQLKEVNEELWKIEDEIRICEKNQDFGIEFIQLARAVYTTNDKRADIKRKINLSVESGLIEEKSYS